MSEDLHDFEYLWQAGSEWGLSQRIQAATELVIVFPAGQPTTKELVSLRQISPAHRNTPVAALKASLSDTPNLSLGDFSAYQAHELAAAARQHGLQVQLNDRTEISYLPVHKRTGDALIIEDDQLARAVTERMINAGVTIISAIEAD